MKKRTQTKIAYQILSTLIEVEMDGTIAQQIAILTDEDREGVTREICKISARLCKIGYGYSSSLQPHLRAVVEKQRRTITTKTSNP
jgi:hypothetical protein